MSDIPYIGLRPYSAEDRNYFFGRETAERLVNANLRALPLTIVHGPSGSGKSSFLHAGIAGRIGAEANSAVVVFSGWVRDSFANALKAQCREVVESRLKRSIDVGLGLPLDEFLSELSRIYSGRLFLFFDQFEEYFRRPLDAETSAFDSEFERTLNSLDIDIKVLIAMREEGLGKLDRFRRSIPDPFGRGVRLDHLPRSAAEIAIRHPIEVYNRTTGISSRPVTIEDGLVFDVLDQLQSAAAAVTEFKRRESIVNRSGLLQAGLLQLVMSELWKAESTMDSRELRLATLRSLGGVQGIVRGYVDRILDGLRRTEQETCARLIPSLAPGRIRAQEIDSLAILARQSACELRPVLLKLSNAAVLTRRAWPEPDSPERYEIFGDMLVPGMVAWSIRYERELWERKCRRLRLAFRICLGCAALALVTAVLAIRSS